MFRLTQNTPLKDHPLATHCEPSALYCWILEILYCTPKGRRALLRIPSTEGRSVCLCWAKSKPKGPKGPSSRTLRIRGLVSLATASGQLTSGMEIALKLCETARPFHAKVATCPQTPWRPLGSWNVLPSSPARLPLVSPSSAVSPLKLVSPYQNCVRLPVSRGDGKT